VEAAQGPGGVTGDRAGGRPGTGRFAPSPTGPLHVGNLRTAVLAWLFARSVGAPFLIRIDDLDRAGSRDEHVRSHIADLAALGIESDGAVVRSSLRFDRYEAALARLDASGLVYPCYCSRREVQAAVSAPHGPLPEGAYPGTCRRLTRAERSARRAEGRRPAWRVRAGGERVEVVDRLHGRFAGVVDDFVVRRADGAPAYQLAVVVDDHEQGITEVVRGDDLLDTTPRQVWLARRLGLGIPAYAHVPLVLGPDGGRLAKRHGAVTLADLRAGGVEPPAVLAAMAVSLGLAPAGSTGAGGGAARAGDDGGGGVDAAARVATVADLLPGFDPGRLSRGPWRFDPGELASTHSR
jgi:glutamyl-tRNA synthetase